VHGDTTSAVAGALCAFHLQIPVAHVEAGLRTHLTRTPFPEELNRQLIARIATFHLAPTTTNAESLVLEGVHAEQIFVTGNTGIDAIRWVAGKHVPYGIPALDNLDERTRLVVVTAHRRENWGTGLIGIGTAVAALARANPDTVFVLPVHPNPVVGDTLRPLLERQHNVLLTPPLSYAPFARLLARAYLAISDSGGIQEEAPAVATPVLVTRDSTERREGLVAGTIRLVGTDPERIVAVTQRLLDDPDMHAAMVGAENPYGDGRAATRIVQAFEHLAFGTEPPLRFGAGFRRDALLRAAGFDIDLLTATRTAPGRGRLREPPEHHVLHNGAAQGRPAAGRPGAPG
jgi:UDP-N-acetylglucosamine 2-epimerase (non-hydrolysing)